MNAPFNPNNIPEQPLTPPCYDLPDPPEVHVSDLQIVQRVTACLSGASDTAFGMYRPYWEGAIRDEWDAEWATRAPVMDLMNIDHAADRIAYIQKMMCIHARELLRDDRVPIEALEEEGLI